MNGKKIEFEREVRRVAELLKKKPHTADAIAREMHCSKVSAYRRVKALAESPDGDRLFTRKVREGERGPVSVEYFFA